jgi:hypothetical protein
MTLLCHIQLENDEKNEKDGEGHRGSYESLGWDKWQGKSGSRR